MNNPPGNLAGRQVNLMPIEPKPQKTDPPQQKITKPTKTEVVRQIILRFGSESFTVADIEKKLIDWPVEINQNVLRVMVIRELCGKQKLIKRVGRTGGRVLFKLRAAAEPTEKKKPEIVDSNEPRFLRFFRGTFASAFVSVAAGLEKFSLNMIVFEMQKTGDWERDRPDIVCHGIINRLKNRGLIETTKNYRPVVYKMTKDFYLYNLKNLILYTEAAPHLENKIMLNFGKHCQDRPEPEKKEPPKTIETRPVEKKKPDEKKVADHKKKQQQKISKKRESSAVVLPAVEREKLTSEIDKLLGVINDRNINLINLKSRLNSLENQAQKLNREIGRLNAKTIEKDRVIASLQNRLNSTRDELSRFKNRNNNAFSLGELAHIK